MMNAPQMPGPQEPMEFDSAIPGQSLTTPPGGMPFEKPPQYPDPEQAAGYLFSRLETPKVMEKAISLMDAGVAIEALAKMLTFTGFSNGKWTPDVAELIQPAVGVYLLGIADRAGIDPVMDMEEEKQGDGDLDIRLALNPDSVLPKHKMPPPDMMGAPEEEAMAMVEELPEAPQEMAEAPQEAMGGFMGMAEGGMG
jgi:hypothetical protein